MAALVAPPPAPLQPSDLRRFSRQMLVPGFGVASQAALARSSVLIVGAGGLGCPVGLYLAAAGVGRIGVVDDDIVEVSNLHRQIAHTEARVGTAKAASLVAAMRALHGSRLVAVAHVVRLAVDNALALVSAYAIVVDATDNPATRYLLNDACVLAGRPLVSGAALATDGQLSVYNYAVGRGLPHVEAAALRAAAAIGVAGGAGADTVSSSVAAVAVRVEGAASGVAGSTADVGGGDAAAIERGASSTSPRAGPCYRCLHPEPPPVSMVASCADAGVLGPITGVIGSLQALQVLQLVAQMAVADDTSGRAGADSAIGEPLAGRMLAFDGADCTFRTLRLRGRRPECAVCGDAPTITSMLDSAVWARARGLLAVEGVDDATRLAGSAIEPCASCPPAPAAGAASCGAAAALPSISAAAFLAVHGATDAAAPALLLDVRERQPFGFVSLRGSLNVPLREVARWLRSDAGAAAAAASSAARGGGRPAAFVLCRRGVDSVEATRTLCDAGWDAQNVEGGLRAIAVAQGYRVGDREDGGSDGDATGAWGLKDVWY